MIQKLISKLFVMVVPCLVFALPSFAQQCVDWSLTATPGGNAKGTINRTINNPGGTSTTTSTGEVGLTFSLTFTIKKAECSKAKKIDKAAKDWNRNKNGVQQLFPNFEAYLLALGVIDVPTYEKLIGARQRAQGSSRCSVPTPDDFGLSFIDPCLLQTRIELLESQDNSFFSWKAVNMDLPIGMQVDWSKGAWYDFNVIAQNGFATRFSTTATLSPDSYLGFAGLVNGYTNYAVSPTDSASMTNLLNNTVNSMGDNSTIEFTVNIPLANSIDAPSFQNVPTSGFTNYVGVSDKSEVSYTTVDLYNIRDYRLGNPIGRPVRPIDN